jgi:hypothetical protein
MRKSADTTHQEIVVATTPVDQKPFGRAIEIIGR